MRGSLVYLYRKDGAQGCATHWAFAPGSITREGFEYLGNGSWVRSKDRFYIQTNYITLADDCIENQLPQIAAQSDNFRHTSNNRADDRDFAIMLNYEQGRAQHEPRSIRDTKRANYCDNLDRLRAGTRIAYSIVPEEKSNTV